MDGLRVLVRTPGAKPRTMSLDAYWQLDPDDRDRAKVRLLTVDDNVARPIRSFDDFATGRRDGEDAQEEEAEGPPRG